VGAVLAATAWLLFVAAKYLLELSSLEAGQLTASIRGIFRSVVDKLPNAISTRSNIPEPPQVTAYYIPNKPDHSVYIDKRNQDGDYDRYILMAFSVLGVLVAAIIGYEYARRRFLRWLAEDYPGSKARRVVDQFMGYEGNGVKALEI